MIAARSNLLIVDDDALIQETLGFLLGKDFDITRAVDRPAAIHLLRDQGLRPEVALVDLGLPPFPHQPDEGLALIGELLDYNPHCKIVVLSGQNELEHARHARTLGALDFIAKPAQPERLMELLRSARQLYQQEMAALSQSDIGERLLGSSAAITKVQTQLAQFASAGFPVLIEGESGTGKEVAANILHEASPRSAKPFIALNCAAIAHGLMEATLFGHAKGAFTGAVSTQLGYFEEAANGTLFLDEVGELPLDLQPKLLRVLENGEYQRVGETQRRHSNARVIAATNRDLALEVQAGRFRADLFHRLSVLRLQMPAVRDTDKDRLVLLDHYLHLFARQMNTQPCRLDESAVAAWLDYDFPGNVRELRNIVIRLLSRYAGRNIGRDELVAEFGSENALLSKRLTPASAEPEVRTPSPDALAQLQAQGSISLGEELSRIEHGFITAALHLARGNMSQAARMLGINRSTLYNRMEALARQGKAVSNHPADES